VQGAVDIVGRAHELDGGAVGLAVGVDDLRDVDGVDTRLLAADASVGEERPMSPRGDRNRSAVHRNLLGLTRSEACEAIVGDKLQIHRRRARSLLGGGERPVLERVVQEPTVVQHLLVLLLELLVDARSQLVAHDDVDDRGRDRDGHGDGERGRQRESKAERHGSRRT